MTVVQISGREISLNAPPFIVAELSGNHGGSLQKALELVEVASTCGVDAIKLQTYKPETMTLDMNVNEFKINVGGLWNGRSLFELYKEGQTPWEWHKEIFDLANKLNLVAFSSPFDATAVDFLQELDVPCFKIASSEVTDLPLIRKVSETGKPLLISTGMASLIEIDEAITAARTSGCAQIVLLKCTASYPAKPEELNLETIAHMRETFGCEVGFSDHTIGIGSAIMSIAYGASVIEKHLSLDVNDGAIDSEFSMTPQAMKQLVEEVKSTWLSKGEVKYGPTESELKSIKYRRSLYAIKDINEGEALSHDNVKAIRPGLGLKIKYIDILIGKKVNKSIKRGTPLNWDIIS